MCLCTPEKRTPFCGKPGCVWPHSGTAKPSGLDLLLDEQPAKNADGSQVWFAVSNPKAVRNQPMALFRLQSDAQLFGGRMILGEVEIVPVTITLPGDVAQPDAPKPQVTIITPPLKEPL
jgi:hypothetical protein